MTQSLDILSKLIRTTSPKSCSVARTKTRYAPNIKIHIKNSAYSHAVAVLMFGIYTHRCTTGTNIQIKRGERPTSVILCGDVIQRKRGERKFRIVLVFQFQTAS
jgi:hypothetical protein